MYTLNMLFNFNETNGLFTGDRGNVALLKSMNWLRLLDPEPADPNPDLANPLAFNPEAARWDNLGQAATLHLASAPNPGHICIRVAPAPPDPTTQPPTPVVPAAATLQLVLCFGRPVRAFQPQASPFTDNGAPNGAVLTTFVFPPPPAPPPPAGMVRNTAVGWFLPLGIIARRPVGPNAQTLTHRYEFSLGIKVTSAGVTRHYAEDPEMDIGP